MRTATVMRSVRSLGRQGRELQRTLGFKEEFEPVRNVALDLAMKKNPSEALSKENPSPSDKKHVTDRASD